MNPTILGIIGPGFLNQVPTLHLETETSWTSTDSTPSKLIGPSLVTARTREWPLEIGAMGIILQHISKLRG